jgi:hypothetical protein
MRGCSSLVAFVPKQQIGFVVLSNKEEDDSEFVTLITKYIHALFTNNTTGVQKWEKSLLDVETKEKETSSNKNQEFQKITPQLASLFAGTYHNDIFGDLVITAGGSALSFTYIDETLDLMCIDNNTFKDKENWEFRFKRNNLDLPDRFDVEIEKGCSYEFVKIK